MPVAKAVSESVCSRKSIAQSQICLNAHLSSVPNHLKSIDKTSSTSESHFSDMEGEEVTSVILSGSEFDFVAIVTV